MKNDSINLTILLGFSTRSRAEVIDAYKTKTDNSSGFVYETEKGKESIDEWIKSLDSLVKQVYVAGNFKTVESISDFIKKFDDSLGKSQRDYFNLTQDFKISLNFIVCDIDNENKNSNDLNGIDILKIQFTFPDNVELNQPSLTLFYIDFIYETFLECVYDVCGVVPFVNNEIISPVNCKREFNDFDEILFRFCPSIGYLQYKRLFKDSCIYDEEKDQYIADLTEMVKSLKKMSLYYKDDE